MINYSESGFYISAPEETDMGDIGRFRNDAFLPLYFQVQIFDENQSYLHSQVNFFKDISDLFTMTSLQKPMTLSYDLLPNSIVKLESKDSIGNTSPFERKICNNTSKVKIFESDTLYFFPRLLSGNGGYEGYDIKAIVKYMFDRRKRG